jgi:hypothetical protein
MEVSMRRIISLLIVSLFVVSFMATVAFAAAETKAGTLKAVDTAKGTIVFCPVGTKDEITLKASKEVIGSFKGRDRVKVTMDAGTATKIVKERGAIVPKPGC